MHFQNIFREVFGRHALWLQLAEFIESQILPYRMDSGIDEFSADTLTEESD